jgi:hypothetical protein
VQYEIFKHTILQVDYIGRHALHLYFSPIWIFREPLITSSLMRPNVLFETDVVGESNCTVLVRLVASARNSSRCRSVTRKRFKYDVLGVPIGYLFPIRDVPKAISS